jgi:thiamine biosynthesis lipoprotein
MAVPFRLVFYAADASTATQAARAAFARVAQLNAILSDYEPESELRRFCATAGSGQKVKLGADLWQVLEKAQQVADRSQGAFDVTVGPVVRLWRRARRLGELPAPESLQAARSLVDYRLLRLHAESRTAELTKPGMRLDLGGIAKGYAVDVALAVLREHGISRAMVEAGGDITLGEGPPGQAGWRLGIAPSEPQGPPRLYLALSRTAVATSGDMFQFVEIDGKRYSHIVDPRTGTALTDRLTVTVIASDGLTADAWATALSVLGPEKGLPLIDATPGMAALVVRLCEDEQDKQDKQDKQEIFPSREWQKLAQRSGGLGNMGKPEKQDDCNSGISATIPP